MTATREDVVREARSWVGTPYLLGARVKGAGADCGTLLLGVYRACELIDDEDLGIYAGDWWVHATEEQYIFRVLRHARQVLEAVAYRTTDVRPGNIVLTRTRGSKIYNHGAIVLAWPQIVHALPPVVAECDASRSPVWGFQRIVAFDPWEEA